ncbi:MAG: HD domain-containing phosphohydrolase [Thermoanaerobaculia bacterium]
MFPEIKALEPQLKEILYGCVEHVQATKAALYLSSTPDLSTKTYELVTAYQFNDSARKTLKATDDLVDRLAVKRGAFFVNGLGSDQRLSEMLFRQGTDRILAAPIFSRGRLVGFIDMRDKAGRKPFDNPDVDAARRIADDILSFLSSKKLFGIAPIPIMAQESGEKPSEAPASAPPVSMPGPQTNVQSQNLTPEAMRAIAAARETLSKRQLTPQATATKRSLTERDLEVVRLLLPATLAIPGAVLACFTSGNTKHPQSIVAIATVMDDAMQMLQDHLRAWMRRHSASGVLMRPEIIYPFGMQIAPVSAAGISTILSAPVNTQSVENLVLTVAFERIPEAQAQRAMHIFLGQIEKSVDAAIAASGARNDRQIIAEKLLEPDFQKYPELLEHARSVAAISQRLAVALDLNAAQIENVRLAALVHDVGMRLLDYDRLYNKPSLTAEQLRGLAEHPIVGAALVEPVLGGEIAQAVLRHHERVDGKGYPSRLNAAQIPLASKIIQIADAWVTMTSHHSYRTPVTREEAMERIREGAGTQFDETIVERFLGSIDQIDT